jgi:hypothetical protein
MNIRNRMNMMKAKKPFLDNEGFKKCIIFHTIEIKIKAIMYCLLQFNAHLHPIFSSLKRYTRNVIYIAKVIRKMNS